MRSRAFRRGLALSAVSALSVAALTTAASATSIDSQVGTGNVVLYSQFGATNDASLKNDGTDSTIHLEAGAGSNISSLTFRYSLNGTDFIDIATVARGADGTFSHEWNAGSLTGATVTLRATGTPAAGVPVSDDQTGVQILGAGSAAEAVNLRNGTALGYFAQPYGGANGGVLAAVSGTTSATAGTVAISRRNGANGAIAGTATNAPVTPTGTFRGVLDITGYPFDTNPTPANQVNQIVVGAERGTDDTEAYTLRSQVITTVTATPDRTNVPTGQTATVTVAVRDADGNAIVGARVAPSTGGAPKYTDVDGNTTFSQGAGTVYYYADATGASGYSAADGDKRSTDVTVTEFTQNASSLAATSADKAAFDYDEYATGDITVQLKDQHGGNVAAPGRTVRYFWTITPFDGSAAVRVPSTSTRTALTDANGKAIIPFPTGAEGRKEGTYRLTAGVEADPTTGTGAVPSSEVLAVRAGEAELTFDDAEPQQALSGTAVPVNGQLTLDDGTGLAGRVIDLSYVRSAETGSGAGAGDSGILQADGTTIGTSRSVTTNPAGEFSVSVKDPAETPQPNENGELRANTGATPAIGDANAPQASQDIAFVASVTPGTVTIAPETPIVAGNATPGRPVTSSVTLKTAGGAPLANQNVTLTTSKGFFTPYATTLAGLTPDPAAAVGADAGEWKSDGTTITVRTNASGVANFALAIEKDADFDDDGQAIATVTATAGTATDTEPVAYSSSNPLNGGAVTVELAEARFQESGVLPKAPTTDKVAFDVVATDQFGNPVGGAPVTIADNVGNADVSISTVTTNFNPDPDVLATSSQGQDQVVTGTWTAPTHKYTAVTPARVITQGTETLTDASTVNWYAIDYADSTYAITHSGAARQPVGSTVTVRYGGRDQNGELIANLCVSFFRTGPDNQQDGNGSTCQVTGQDGLVDYVFQGTKSGTAVISAVARQDSSSGAIVTPGQRETSVVFGGVAINAGLQLKSSGNKDVATVTAGKANGATVTLYKVVNGKRVKVATGTIAGGKKIFRVADRNRRKFTTYVAVVSKTARTLADTTPERSIR